MSSWQKCIITYLDFPGVKELAASGKGSRLMLKIHRHATSNAQAILRLHTGAYIWNDSILLVAHFSHPKEKKAILKEQSAFKVAIGARFPKSHQPYAIVVQGKSLPSLGFTNNSRPNSPLQVVILKSSSWAMANCFEIEHALRKKKTQKKALWYIDKRVIKSTKLKNKQYYKKLPLLPSSKCRDIVMLHDDHLRFG